MKFDLATIISKFNNLQAPLRYGIFASVIIIIFVLDFFSAINMQRILLIKTDERIQKVQEDIERVSISKQRLPQNGKNLDIVRKNLDGLYKKIRPVSEIPALLEDISRSADDVGVKFNQLTPLRDKQEILIKNDTETYFSLLIYVETRASYHAFGRFLNRLDKENIYFSIKSLTMSNDDQKEDEGPIIHAELKVIMVDKND